MNVYPSVVEVDVCAMRRNIAYAQSLLEPSCRLIAVVKANAYGHGDVAVSRVALDMGAWALAVANREEAARLREAYPKARILVLGPAMPCEMQALAQMQVWPTVFYPEQVEALQAAAEVLGHEVSCHVAVDTGMNRIGTRPGERLEALLQAFSQCPQVKMEGIFSHLFHADGNDQATQAQRAVFEEALCRVRQAGHNPIVHLSNSAAALYRNHLHYDAVRLGIGMYGLEPWEKDENLTSVMTWKTHVAFLHEAQAGETVSYGGDFTVDRPMRIATLPVGYADDYPRQLSGKAEVLIRGSRARILGRICMDQMMVDVTDIPDVALGDEVVLLGRQGAEEIHARELAQICGTIHYEIVTGAGRRAPRVYCNE